MEVIYVLLESSMTSLLSFIYCSIKILMKSSSFLNDLKNIHSVEIFHSNRMKILVDFKLLRILKLYKFLK